MRIKLTVKQLATFYFALSWLPFLLFLFLLDYALQLWAYSQGIKHSKS